VGALSTHFYVCEIRGFCHEPVPSLTNVVTPETMIAHDSLNKPVAVEKETIPQSMLIYLRLINLNSTPGTITDSI